MHRILVSFVEGAKIAMQAIWTNKTRAMLTTTCIVIGIVSVTAMNTITDGVDRSFDESMDMLGKNVLFVEKWPWGIGGGEYKWWEYRNRREMKLEYAEQLQNLSKIATEVSAQATRSVTIRYQDKYADNVDVNGATTNYFKTAGLDIDEGRFFSESDVQRAGKVAVLGASVAEKLFQNNNPIGKHIRIRGQRFFVIGVMKKQGNFLGVADSDNRILIPISAFKALYSLRWGLQISVQFPDEKSMEEGEYELEGLMRRIRQLDPMEENDFAINKASLFEQQFDSMKTAIYGIGIFLTSLALFVGGIGVMNIMYVSVKERTREIGIRKAVGAKSWEILLQFLMEAIVICLIGGVIGVLMSVGITHLINQFFVAYMDWTTVLNAILICAFIGILFGFLPSNKAAKADPIDSLRYE